MIRFNLSVVAVALTVSLLGAHAAQAKDKKPPEVPGELFFTAKGQHPFALQRVHPGITAALMLSDQQKIALFEALQQTTNSPEVRAAGAALKNNPDATDADRAKAQKVRDDARAQLKEAIDKTLTADQKALIVKIQAAFDESQKAAAEELKPEFAQAKANREPAAKLNERMQEELREQLTQRLDKVLDAEQKAAVLAAGVAQLEQEDAASKAKKQK